MELTHKMFFFDTNSRMSYTSSSSQKEMIHGYSETHLCPTHGLSTPIRFSAYVLVAIVKKQLKLEESLYTIPQILSITLFK